MTVSVAIDPEALQQVSQGVCQVGRSAKVYFAKHGEGGGGTQSYERDYEPGDNLARHDDLQNDRIPNSGQPKRTGDRAVMTGGGDQHEAVPDRVLIPQLRPHVEDDADGIQDAAKQDQKDRALRKRGGQLLKDEESAPAEKQVERDRGTIEAPWIFHLQKHTKERR